MTVYTKILTPSRLVASNVHVTLQIALCAAALYFVTGNSYARDLEAKPYYMLNTGVTDVHFDSLSAADSAFRAWWGTQYHDPGDTLQELFELPNGEYINGEWNYHGIHCALPGNPRLPQYVCASIITYYECPANFSPYSLNFAFRDNGNNSAYCSNPDEAQQPDTCPRIGNPILPSTGVKEQIETDYQGGGTDALRFTRTYRSDRNGWASNYQAFGIDFTNTAQSTTYPNDACYSAISSSGHPYCFKYIATGLANDFAIRRGNGRMLNFGNAVNLSPAADICQQRM